MLARPGGSPMLESSVQKATSPVPQSPSHALKIWHWARCSVCLQSLGDPCPPPPQPSPGQAAVLSCWDRCSTLPASFLPQHASAWWFFPNTRRVTSLPCSHRPKPLSHCQKPESLCGPGTHTPFALWLPVLPPSSFTLLQSSWPILKHGGLHPCCSCSLHQPPCTLRCHQHP